MLSAAVLIAASMVGGQPEVSPNYEHLKQFDEFIGTWVYEGPVLENIPGFPGKGTPMTVHMTWRWLYNKAAVEFQWKAKIGNLPVFEGKNLDGWNAAEKEIVSRGVASTGSVTSGTVTFSDDGKRLTGSAETVAQNGEKTSGNFVYVFENTNTFVRQDTNRQGQGLPPDGPKYRFKRVQQADDHDD